MNLFSRLLAFFRRPAPQAGKPARKPRPRMGRVVCPGCQRHVAYSSVTQRTVLHRCASDVIKQGSISPSTDAAGPVFSRELRRAMSDIGHGIALEDLLPESLFTAADVRPVPRGKGTAGSPDLASTALTGD